MAWRGGKHEETTVLTAGSCTFTFLEVLSRSSAAGEGMVVEERDKWSGLGEGGVGRRDELAGMDDGGWTDDGGGVGGGHGGLMDWDATSQRGYHAQTRTHISIKRNGRMTRSIISAACPLPLDALDVRGAIQDGETSIAPPTLRL